ncbi:class I SAM-dependent DNA methyltransferase [Tahibacter amnicola]|uniref:Class I SAM-dependent methyltransferase n=1 Tax=Tahibacter amnicola TaxID=2976241 RepID=A0ABY6BIG5_9GAMM|nr:class I SAM-dependent methyltransferase [Tahibacter amnicola]UXI69803.1 class I SAM-dependent methyltransferase [Tahibacter amnicola]
MNKQYDRAYFDKWYRDKTHRVGTAQTLARKVAMAVAMCEHYIGRPIRNVLDVGCGEGAWFKPLKALRPDAAYLGLDPSEYVVSRWGRRRNLRQATFGQLAQLRFDERFDLVVCADVLHYVKTAELKRGLGGIVDQLEGLAYLEVYTSDDQLVGDMDGFQRRTAQWYRQVFAEAGLQGVGSYGWVGPRQAPWVTAMESASR